MGIHEKHVILSKVHRLFLIFGILLTSTLAMGQFGEKGLMFSIGMGSGYSTHAESYSFEDQVRVREFPGFRIYIFDAKLGWNFGEQTAIYLTGNISPGNTTITPYRSKYAGIAISQSLGYASSFYVKAGAGYYSSAVEKDETVGTGILANVSLGMAMSQKTYIELNTYFGQLDEENYLLPNPFNSGEFQVTLLISYAIF